MSAYYAPQEKQYFDQLFTVVDKDNAGVLPGQDALPFLVTSGLPQQTLGEIWALADPDNNGFLTREGWYKAARLIGWMQKGKQSNVDDSLSSTNGPYPTFAGQAPPPPQVPLSAQTTGQRPQPSAATTNAGANLPPLKPTERTKFTRIFVGCGPQNGLVSGDKARNVFVKSQLGYDQLAQIWNLADTQQRGSLDLPDFIIGMFLIQSCMANPSLSLPAILPPGTYEQASGGRPPPPLLTTSPVARQIASDPSSPVRPQYTGGPAGSGILQPQRTGQGANGHHLPPTPPRGAPSNTINTPPTTSTFSTLPSTSSFGAQNRQKSGAGPQQAQWDVTSEAKATSDEFFAKLDAENKGAIEGDVAVPFMLQSQLEEGVLANIWDLADIRHEGRLTRDEFAVAMHLINTKLAGQEVPSSLPTSLIPPSLRDEYGAGSQEVSSGQGASSTTKDLFDLFDDPPAAAPSPPAAVRQPATHQQQPTPFQSAAFLPQPPSRRMTAQTTGQRQMSPPTSGQQPQMGFGQAAFPPSTARSPPPSDLLGDDSAESAPASSPDNSAELGNKRNQLANTTRSHTDLGNTRAELEKSTASVASEVLELETKLSEARVKLEAETKAVAELRTRRSEQATQLQHLREDVIAAESDLSAMRSEKDELGQGLLRDKEEVRGLQKRMQENEDEKTILKITLEKLRKEARQQKGMVSIAKKQLSTAEGSRDSLRKDIHEAEDLTKEESPAGSREFSQSAEPTEPFSPSIPPTAAGIPLPGTPRALSPTTTGTLGRSNNPFDRLSRSSQSRSGPPIPQTSPVIEPAASTSIGTAGLGGVGTVVEAAAGVVVAGVETLYTAAKDAVSPQAEERSKEIESSVVDAHPSVGAPPGEQRGEAHPDTDPFGASFTAVPTQSAFDSEFGSGFGDSFSAPTKTIPAPSEDMHLAASSEQPQAFNDFHSTFSDLDNRPGNTRQDQPQSDVSVVSDMQGIGIPSGIPKSAIPANLRPEAERSFSTQATAPSSMPGTPIFEAVPYNSNGSPPLRSEVEPTRSSEAVLLSPHAPAAEVEELVSSEDENEEPEDLDTPRNDLRPPGRTSFEPREEVATQPAAQRGTGIAPPLPVLSPPLTSYEEGRIRRSAPPPPSLRSTSASMPRPAHSMGDFDPFGAPAERVSSALPPGAAPADPSDSNKAPRFDDDDDFDFSDLPPAQVEQASGAPQLSGQQPPSSFDEFAGFDDDFDKPSSQPNSGSDNSTSMTKSYEMVSPQPSQQPFNGQSSDMLVPTPRTYDEWGLGGMNGQKVLVQPSAPPPNAPGFSFDDAFGEHFDTVPPTTQAVPPAHNAEETQYVSPSGPSPSQRTGNLNPPALPERRDSQPQADDLEDVKKLCAMGFSRSLVIEALDANGYDFQKALNVLLVK